MAKRKYYVVWRGRKRGVFNTWTECAAQVMGFADAAYKAFGDRAAAEAAFVAGADEDKKAPDAGGDARPTQGYAVDAACSGNPGEVEYRGVDLATGKEVFRAGPFPYGTNNIGEFLAIVHALALLHKAGSDLPVYCDSRVALLWVKRKKCRTKLLAHPAAKAIFDLVKRAEAWLAAHSYVNPICKWHTEIWGEIPADFGRK
ncbi:MAG: ribonuclease H family protein [Planctomycetota bacterium]|nr:ribonuclease H family protein [Planctomycetota bacterium]